MLIVAIILFIVGGIFGAMMLYSILLNRYTPGPAASLHGIAVIVALVILIDFIRGHIGPKPLLSMWLLVGAAILGFILLILTLLRRQPPKILAIIHPLVAIAGFVLLFAYVLR